MGACESGRDPADAAVVERQRKPAARNPISVRFARLRFPVSLRFVILRSISIRSPSIPPVASRDRAQYVAARADSDRSHGERDHEFWNWMWELDGNPFAVEEIRSDSIDLRDSQGRPLSDPRPGLGSARHGRSEPSCTAAHRRARFAASTQTRRREDESSRRSRRFVRGGRMSPVPGISGMGGMRGRCREYPGRRLRRGSQKTLRRLARHEACGEVRRDRKCRQYLASGIQASDSRATVVPLPAGATIRGDRVSRAMR